MTDPTARDRYYLCDFRDDGEGGFLPAIVAEAGGHMPNWAQADVVNGRCKIKVIGCTDFMDDAIMGVSGTKRTTA